MTGNLALSNPSTGRSETSSHARHKGREKPSGMGMHAAKELVSPGTTGFLVENLSAMVQRIPDLHSIDREAVRAYAEARFSAHTMARRSTRVSQEVIKRQDARRPA